MGPPSQLREQGAFVEPLNVDHAPILESRDLHWADEAECAEAALVLAQRPGLREASIELRGPLGAGKTTFVRHLLRALGVQGPIKSPTYALMEPYERPNAADAQATPDASDACVERAAFAAPETRAAPDSPGAQDVLDTLDAPGIYHFDFYRFDNAQEWEDAGFREIFASRGLKLVEWPDKAGNLLPGPDLRIVIDADANERRQVRFCALTPRGVALLP